MKKIFYFFFYLTGTIILLLILGLGGSWLWTQIAHGAATTTPDFVEPGKTYTLSEKYAMEQEKTAYLDNLVSKYAQLYDSCKWR